MGAKGFEFVVRGKLDPKALGAELRKLREAANVTVGDLAGRMGWHSANISRLERGGTDTKGKEAREPTSSSVALYLRALGYQMVIVAKPKPPLRRTSAAGKSTAVETLDEDDET